MTDRYTTALTQDGTQTYVFDGEETMFVATRTTHAEDARRVAELLNEQESRVEPVGFPP